MESIRDDGKALDRRFVFWKYSRSSAFKPTPIGHIKEAQFGTDIPVGYWPGSIDTYFDLYVAGVWNIFRAARLLLLALNIRCSKELGEDYAHHIRAATDVVEDMITSVPYHLMDNLPAFLLELESASEIREPGRFLGGLLLMYPLYVASRLPFLPEQMREYLRACLLWIGSRMGIGQATLLAKVGRCHGIDKTKMLTSFGQESGIDRDYLASGCMIVWSGFLW
jgi:hypothetical protein